MGSAAERGGGGGRAALPGAGAAAPRGCQSPRGRGRFPAASRCPGNDGAGAAGAPRRQRAPAPRPAPPRGRQRRAGPRVSALRRSRAGTAPGSAFPSTEKGPGVTRAAAGKAPGDRGAALVLVPSRTEAAAVIPTPLGKPASFSELAPECCCLLSASPAPCLVSRVFLLRPVRPGGRAC